VRIDGYALKDAALGAIAIQTKLHFFFFFYVAATAARNHAFPSRTGP
jgi:hypothetical protein